jgi:hypothetical protein
VRKGKPVRNALRCVQPGTVALPVFGPALLFATIRRTASRRTTGVPGHKARLAE